MCICDPVKWYACGEENTNNANSSLTLSIQLPSSMENNLENMAGRQIISPAASGVAGEKTVLQELLEAMTVIYQTQPSSLLELCINTNRPAYRKSLHLQSSFFSPIWPLMCLMFAPHWPLTLNCLEDNWKGQFKQTVEKMHLSSPLLGKTTTTLLTWPYLSQTPEGRVYFDKSTTCISFIFCHNISPQLAAALSLSVSTHHTPRCPQRCGE